MAGPEPVVFSVEDKIIYYAINCASLAICIIQTFMDTAHNDAGELVFNNFSVVAKSLTCFKMFITAYHDVPTKGSEMFGFFVCLLAFFLHVYAITSHLDMNRTAWARTKIVGMATLMGTGVFLLCRGMLIPKDHVWNTVVVPAFLIFVEFTEAALLIHTQINEDGGNQNLPRDLLITLAETLISTYQFVDYAEEIHCPCDTEKIFHLVGSGLPVLIGICHVCWITYKMGIFGMVVEWIRVTLRVFAGNEEQAAGAATESDGDGHDGDGDTEQQQIGEEGVEVVVAVPA